MTEPQPKSTPRGELVKIVHKRATNKKSRNGCYCCKKRRVKCDETKPNCLRCIAFNIECDGYPGPAPRRSGMKKESRPVRPIADARLLLATPSSELKFADELEERHFGNFQRETAAELAGIFDTTFWNRLLLQTCHEEPFVLKIVMALSAASTSKKLSRRINSNPINRVINVQQTRFALKQYQTALKEIRTSLANTADIRKAVIACLLVCCFESLLGNTASAHTHALSGQKLLEHWLTQHPYTKARDAGIASPAHHLLEDDILKAGVFFDTQILSTEDPRPAHVHAKLRLEGDEAVAHMPKRFKDIGEAHSYIFLIYKRTLHSCREIGELCHDGRLSTSSEYKFLDDGMDELSIAPTVTTVGQTKWSTILPVKTPNAFIMQQEQYLSELRRWREAFTELYESIKLSVNKRLLTAAHTLYTLAKGMPLCVYVSLDTDNCSCDHLSSLFHEVYSLASEIVAFVKSDDNRLPYQFELSVIPLIFVVARFCRERDLRRKAIALMEGYDMREGIWDAVRTASFMRRLMELEEDGVETDYIPEGARVRVIEEIFHVEERWCRIKYIRGTKRTGETVGETVYKW